MGEILARLLESRAGVTVMALLLLAAQLLAAGGLALAWGSHPAQPVAFSMDGLSFWLMAAIGLYGVDVLFVLLCDRILMSRRQAMVDAGISAAMGTASAEVTAVQLELATTRTEVALLKADVATAKAEVVVVKVLAQGAVADRDAAMQQVTVAVAARDRAQNDLFSMRMLAEEAGHKIGWKLIRTTTVNGLYPEAWEKPPAP